MVLHEAELWPFSSAAGEIFCQIHAYADRLNIDPSVEE